MQLVGQPKEFVLSDADGDGGAPRAVCLANCFIEAILHLP